VRACIPEVLERRASGDDVMFPAKMTRTGRARNLFRRVQVCLVSSRTARNRSLSSLACRKPFRMSRACNLASFLVHCGLPRMHLITLSGQPISRAGCWSQIGHVVQAFPSLFRHVFVNCSYLPSFAICSHCYLAEGLRSSPARTFSASALIKNKPTNPYFAMVAGTCHADVHFTIQWLSMVPLGY
jgi:hypothetical protein